MVKGQSVLVAVDTNILLDQAIGDQDVIDAIGVIKSRLPESKGFYPLIDKRILLPSTADDLVLGESCLEMLNQCK